MVLIVSQLDLQAVSKFNYCHVYFDSPRYCIRSCNGFIYQPCHNSYAVSLVFTQLGHYMVFLPLPEGGVAAVLRAV